MEISPKLHNTSSQQYKVPKCLFFAFIYRAVSWEFLPNCIIQVANCTRFQKIFFFAFIHRTASWEFLFIHQNKLQLLWISLHSSEQMTVIVLMSDKKALWKGSVDKSKAINSYSASRDNWCTVGGDGGM